jgi:hypothetical protein
MDHFEMWKQRREEMMREVRQNRLAGELRGSRVGLGSRLLTSVGWEMRRGAGRLRKLFRATGEDDRKRGRS